ncbi:hypothetical protein [Actinoplanes philippinensis]|uniref:hypothetical protein n=1 Tax=Actinoplanes philippinensis TaxID=35752 RepID=UPI0033C87064
MTNRWFPPSGCLAGAAVMTSAPVQDYIHSGSAVMEKIVAAYRSGLPADAGYARELAGRLVSETAAALGGDDSPQRRERLAAAYRMIDEFDDTEHDERYEATHGRYLALVAAVNATPADPNADLDFGGLSRWLATALDGGQDRDEPAGTRRGDSSFDSDESNEAVS